MVCEELVGFSGGAGRKGLRRHSLFWAGGWRLEECAWWRVIMWPRGTSDPQQKLCMPLSARGSRSSSQTVKPSPSTPGFKPWRVQGTFSCRAARLNSPKQHGIQSNKLMVLVEKHAKLLVEVWPQALCGKISATLCHLLPLSTEIRPGGVVWSMSDYVVVLSELVKLSRALCQVASYLSAAERSWIK